MKKSVIILAFVLVLASACVAAERDNFYLQQVGFYNEYAHPGNVVTLSLGLDVHGTAGTEDTTVAIEVPELGIRERLAGFNLENMETLVFDLYIPYGTPKGEYAARITVYSDYEEHLNRIMYRMFYVY